MAILDSIHVFQERIKDLGLEALRQKFKENGWESYGNFAFALDFQAGSINNAEFSKEI